jgi:Tfp pilus assembly protein PilE
MIAHIFAMLPAKSYKIYITSEKKTVATLTMVEMKNSVNEFWKAYVKTPAEKSEDVFYESLSHRLPSSNH